MTGTEKASARKRFIMDAIGATLRRQIATRDIVRVTRNPDGSILVECLTPPHHQRFVVEVRDA